MHISSHRDKVNRLLQLRERLDPLDDFELWYWSALTAGTNMWNASLHAVGLTDEDRAFSTIPGVFVVPQADGGFKRELREPGDVSHVGWPDVAGEKSDTLLLMERALHELEQFRDPCLRGDRLPSQAIVDECNRLIEMVKSAYDALTQKVAL